MAETRIRFDSAAQLVAVHLRHDHVAHDERGLAALCGLKRESSVRGGGDAVAVLFEDVLQSLRLSGAVLGN